MSRGLTSAPTYVTSSRRLADLHGQMAYWAILMSSVDSKQPMTAAGGEPLASQTGQDRTVFGAQILVNSRVSCRTDADGTHHRASKGVARHQYCHRRFYAR
ncbi:hypothetical protein XA68_11268 [Ophiocordyceps unilateralis]|uniref:Uncharacterized protein n=1 Tax=Ophiocordyceps unilateralis TaxID=268505 RepID=A0A2A9PGU4_OPHUN|nr:hypothetical protein XA68_11268 [Ophiocordyceps unilateralis]